MYIYMYKHLGCFLPFAATHMLQWKTSHVCYFAQVWRSNHHIFLHFKSCNLILFSKRKMLQVIHSNIERDGGATGEWWEKTNIHIVIYRGRKRKENIIKCHCGSFDSINGMWEVFLSNWHSTIPPGTSVMLLYCLKTNKQQKDNEAGFRLASGG